MSLLRDLMEDGLDADYRQREPGESGPRPTSRWSGVTLLIGMIIAEFYTTISGLGFMITKYANVFEMDKTFVPVIVLMVLGVSLTSLLKWVGRRIAPWSAANR